MTRLDNDATNTPSNAGSAPEPKGAEPFGTKDGPQGAQVTVCVCTFRRPSLIAAIESIASQRLPHGAELNILVVDNDMTPSAKEITESFRAGSSARLQYRHAPGRNISAARNEALRVVSTRWLAFLDDDEYASPDWLARLLAARAGANVVFGPCQAIYPHGTAPWIRVGDYHSNRIAGEKSPIDTGYTSNVLIDLDFVRDNLLQFDPALGRTGGEDTFFFQAMYRRGAVLRYAPDAVVYEDVAPSRLNFRWIARRKFRAGQVYALMWLRFDSAAYRRDALSSPLKIGACLVMSGLTLLDPRRAMWWLARGIFHAGVLGYVCGMKIYQEYGDALADASPPTEPSVLLRR